MIKTLIALNIALILSKTGILNIATPTITSTPAHRAFSLGSNFHVFIIALLLF